MNKILFMDLETTSLDITSARIIQIGLIKNDKPFSILLNPLVSIENSHIHGIRDEDVQFSSTFSDISMKLKGLIEDCDMLVGYNIKNFDWPILYIEFLRCGIDLKKPIIVDVLELVKGFDSSNKLSDVYLRYFKKSLVGAHNAVADINATKEIYDYLLDKFYK